MSAEQFVVGCIQGQLPAPPVIREFVEEYRKYASMRGDAVSYPRHLDEEANAIFDMMVEALS